MLKPGGTALFIEPLAGNPFLRVFRLLTPKVTVDEKPLSAADLQRIADECDLASRYYGTLSAPVAAIT